MPLHPQVQGLLQQLADNGVKKFHEMEHTEARAMFLGLCQTLPPSTVTLASVTDRSVSGPGGDFGVRVYTPLGKGPFPVLTYFHGGGWVFGSVDTHDGVCRELAAGAGCVVVSVDYRLAPENKFPAAPDDAFAAVKWVAQNAGSLNVDASRIAVGGDSAGGNLSAGVAQRCRDENGPKLAAQLLIYPVARVDGVESASMKANAEGYLLEKADMEWFVGHYLGTPADGVNVRASPLLAKDLSKLPPAMVITAEYDPLCDEGEAYADAMAKAGVPVTKSRYDGAIHGFYQFYPALEQGQQAIAESCKWLREQLKA